MEKDKINFLPNDQQFQSLESTVTIFKFKSEELKELKQKFDEYADFEKKVDINGFKQIIGKFFGSLKELTSLIFDAIIKQEESRINFKELVNFFEELLSKEDTNDLTFSFRLLTKNKKNSFNKNDLKLFLQELKKLDPESNKEARKLHTHEVLSIAEENIQCSEDEIQIFTDLVFNEFNKEGNLENIYYDRFAEVLKENDFIYLTFKSLNGGLADLILFKESEQNMKNFIQQIAIVEEEIMKFLEQEGVEVFKEIGDSIRLGSGSIMSIKELINSPIRPNFSRLVKSPNKFFKSLRTIKDKLK